MFEEILWKHVRNLDVGCQRTWKKNDAENFIIHECIYSNKLLMMLEQITFIRWIDEGKLRFLIESSPPRNIILIYLFTNCVFVAFKWWVTHYMNSIYELLTQSKSMANKDKSIWCFKWTTNKFPSINCFVQGKAFNFLCSFIDILRSFEIWQNRISISLNFKDL